MSFFIKLKHPQVDYRYVDLRDDPRRINEKRLVESMWVLFKPFADKRFQKRSQRQFDACMWEMYLAYCLSKNGFELQERRADAPDICAVKDGQKYWLEAVVPDLGNGDDAVPPVELRGKDRKVPAHEIILRYTSVIKSKVNQLQKKMQKGVISSRDCVLIAICSHLIAMHYWFFSLDHYLGRALYGIGDAYVNWDKETDEVSEVKYTRQDYVLKKSGAKVEKDFFFWTENGILSGVLYCPTINLQNPTCGKEFIIFPNLFPDNPLPDSEFRFCNKGTVVEKSDLFSLHFKDGNPLHLV